MDARPGKLEFVLRGRCRPEIALGSKQGPRRCAGCSGRDARKLQTGNAWRLRRDDAPAEWGGYNERKRDRHAVHALLRFYNFRAPFWPCRGRKPLIWSTSHRGVKPTELPSASATHWQRSRPWSKERQSLTRPLLSSRGGQRQVLSLVKKKPG